MKKLFLTLFIVFYLPAFAQPKMEVAPKKIKNNFQVYLMNPEIRFERDEDQSLAQRKPLNYSIGFKREFFSGLLELINFKTNSGNSSLSINREVQEYLLWGRLHFLEFESVSNAWSVYAGGALGTNQKTVITTLNGSITTDTGKKELAGGLNLGTDWRYSLSPDFASIIGAEVRLLFGKQNDPNPQPSALLRIGFQL